MFFWVFLRRQYVVCRRFGTMCQFHLQRLEVDCLLLVYFQPLKMELTHGSETSAHYILTPGKYPKEHLQYSNHGEILKSTIECVGLSLCLFITMFNFQRCLTLLTFSMPVPVAATSTEQVCSCSSAQIVGSNPTGGMHVRLL
jgi:hypothetical protein